MSVLASINIRPSGDRANDGQVQLSFTLPVGLEMAHTAAFEICKKMNLFDIQIVHIQTLSNSNTYLQVYAKTNFEIKISSLPNVQRPILLDRDEIITLNQYRKEPIKIIGACTGTDAHTVGLDAILNKKGYKGEKGLESYPFLSIINLGSQIKPKLRNRKLKFYKLLIFNMLLLRSIRQFNITLLKFSSLDLRIFLLRNLG